MKLSIGERLRSELICLLIELRLLLLTELSLSVLLEPRQEARRLKPLRLSKLLGLTGCLWLLLLEQLLLLLIKQSLLLCLLHQLLLSLYKGLLLLGELLSLRRLLRLDLIVELPRSPQLASALPSQLGEVRLSDHSLLAVHRGQVEILRLNLYDLLETNSRAWI